jgi:hypothetical protein
MHASCRPAGCRASSDPTAATSTGSFALSVLHSNRVSTRTELRRGGGPEKEATRRRLGVDTGQWSRAVPVRRVLAWVPRERKASRFEAYAWEA